MLPLAKDTVEITDQGKAIPVARPFSRTKFFIKIANAEIVSLGVGRE